MSCLTNAEIQELADGEGSDAARLHAAGCARCAERASERTHLLARLTRSIGTDIELPAHLSRRIHDSFTGGTAGATRLRRTGRVPRRPLWSAGFAGAATLLAVLVVPPMLRRPATVSAAEILAASAATLQSPGTGIEELEYELVVDGVPRDIMPDHADGTYRVWQAIDHNTPGRFRFASYAPDGQPISSIAQDPRHHRRVMMMAIEGQVYRFETTLPAAIPLSLPELERLHMEATITMMQASGNQSLQVVETAGGQAYRIEVHGEATAAASPVWDLTHARVLVGADDYRITELAVSGTLLRQPYSLSYKLIRSTMGASLPPAAFDVPEQAGQIEFSGEGSAVPARDAVILAFRELTRLKQGR